MELNTTREATFEDALAVLNGMTAEELNRFLGWLCSADPLLVIDQAEKMRAFNRARR